MNSSKETMPNFSEYDIEGKNVLITVLEKIREQWVINGCPNQFWFYATQIDNASLTEPVIIKWLTVLRNKGVLYFYRPSLDYATTTSIILDQRFVNKSEKRIIDEAHDWQKQMWDDLLLNMPPDSYPGIAIDLGENSLDPLIDTLKESTKYIYGKFNKDSLDRYYYGDVILSEINDSPLRKKVLSELLSRKNHTLTAAEIDDLLSDEGDGSKRRRVMSDLSIALRHVNHEIEIKTNKDGHKADNYKLMAP